MKTKLACPITALAMSALLGPMHAAQPYTIVDTGQTRCYDNRSEIAPPKPGQPFYGQDAQFQGHPASYTLSADGLTVRDNVTGLTWQRSPDMDGNGILNRADKLTLTQAQALPAKLNAAKFGGFDDWRLPSIKEQYSLFDARGTDPSGPRDLDASRLTPYLDTKFFKFAYGDTSAGERVIDSQYASSTKYVGKGPRGFDKLFGVNFADGRIKGYDLFMPGGGMEKTFFVLCVRGNPGYGKNDFHDNGDGTITDRATGLIWSKADSGQGMNWQDALAWVQKKNAEKFLGHDDWRLPSVKELHSIVDYTRAPDTTHSPAIDPVFDCATITNEAHQADFPFYWSATTHAGFMGGSAAMYVAFGRAAGWMSPRVMAGGPPERRGDFGRGPGPGPGFGGPAGAGPQGANAGDYHYVDVHGAGAQRSDPKAGDPALFPHGRGPQGDVIRIYNFVRLVRGGGVVSRTEKAPLNSAEWSGRTANRVSFLLSLACRVVSQASLPCLSQGHLKLGITKREQVVKGLHLRSLLQLQPQSRNSCFQLGARFARLVSSDQGIGQGDSERCHPKTIIGCVGELLHQGRLNSDGLAEALFRLGPTFHLPVEGTQLVVDACLGGEEVRNIRMLNDKFLEKGQASAKAFLYCL